jgi:hypothetical protein
MFVVVRRSKEGSAAAVRSLLTSISIRSTNQGTLLGSSKEGGNFQEEHRQDQEVYLESGQEWSSRGT